MVPELLDWGEEGTFMSVLLGVSIVLAAAAIAVSWFLIPRLVEVHNRLRGKPFVTCPEAGLPAEVEVDAMHAALSTITGAGRPHLRLSNCSRWPEKRNCRQECLAQIQESPDACIVGSLVQQWYEGTSCVLCDRPLGEFRWYEHHPAALSPEGMTLAWNTVALERLPEVMATHRPVCWNCHIIETFRREHGNPAAHRPTHIRSIA
jgi:hypothetical protein